MSKKTNSIERNEQREEILRPCPFLGYDRDALGIHLYSRGAYKIAETQFRRAIWLNPHEPLFKIHLAQCLRRLGKHEEALSLMESISDERKGKEGKS
jgi:tetratricopeptide (TPR) repeat protein